MAYLVCKRNGVAPRSETYLAKYLKEDISLDQVDVYQIMRAAGQVEAILGLSGRTKYERPRTPSPGIKT